MAAAEVKFAASIGTAPISIQKASLKDAPVQYIVLFVSKSFIPVGREGAVVAPKDSANDKNLLSLHSSKGASELGGVLEVQLSEITAPNVLVVTVPRNNLRRDETKELLFGATVKVLQKASGSSIAFEAVDGNKVFAIPQQQIAEVFCDALLYYFRKHIITNTSVMFTSGSASICDIYANVFQRKFDRPPLFPPTAPVKMTDDEAIQHYGATQRQIYNNAGSESLQTTLFDIFCSLERTFSRPRNPVVLTQVKYFLREIHGATDSELDAIVEKRKKQCLASIPDVLATVKNDHISLFREMCSRSVQFSKEILIASIREYDSKHEFIPPGELEYLLSKYCADDQGEGKKVHGRDKITRRQSDLQTKRGLVSSSNSISPSSSSTSIPTRGSSKRITSVYLTSALASDVPTRVLKVLKKSEGVEFISSSVKLLELLLADDFQLLQAILAAADSADADRLASSLVRIFYFADEPIELIRQCISKEVQDTTVASTLLRGNSIATKAMTSFSRLVAQKYIYDLLKPTLDRIATDAFGFEVDATRLKDPRVVDAQRKKLISITGDLLEDIKKSISSLPLECRQICAVLKEEVSKKFSSQTNAAVAGYLILRLINPAIATPDFFGIIAPTAMSTDIRRALILLSKMVQNIANNVDFKKEAYMTHFNDYVVTASPPFAEFLIASATVPPNLKPSPCVIKPQTIGDDMKFLSTALRGMLPKIQSIDADVAGSLQAIFPAQ